MHLQTSQTPFITLRGYYHNVIKQQVNFLIQYESDCGYTKGIILQTQYGRDFVVL